MLTGGEIFIILFAVNLYF